MRTRKLQVLPTTYMLTGEMQIVIFIFLFSVLSQMSAGHEKEIPSY